MRTLSKSKIIAFRQCPKRLWLELHRPDLIDHSASEMIFAIGNQVGEVARQIYDPAGTGKLIDINEIGWDAAYRETNEWLSTTEAPLFEAALRIEGALALADVMIPERSGDGLRWHMLEVKSSTTVKDYHPDDLAVQVYIATKAGIDLASASIAHVDNTFVYPGGRDYQDLLKKVDLTEEVFGMADEVAGWLEDAQDIAPLDDEPEVLTGSHCSKPFACPFVHHCHRGQQASEFPLSSLYRLGSRRRQELDDLGINDLRDAPEESLSAVNRIIKNQSQTGEAWFDAEGAAADLAPHRGTAYFLDFETIAFGVPIWKGTRPYKQLPFQFSLHIIKADGEMDHQEFLDISGDDPGESFARSLIELCGNTGPVFVYNAGFENGVMRRLAQQFPEHSAGLLAITQRVVDLLPIARKRYYHPSQHGSWSIKAVLPAVCPDLAYTSLQGVQDGMAAQGAFLEAIAPSTTAERKTDLKEQLLAYCELDTLALVHLWKFFRGDHPTPPKTPDLGLSRSTAESL